MARLALLSTAATAIGVYCFQSDMFLSSPDLTQTLSSYTVGGLQDVIAPLLMTFHMVCSQSGNRLKARSIMSDTLLALAATGSMHFLWTCFHGCQPC